MPTHKLYLASDALSCTTLVTNLFESERGPVARFAETVCHARGGGQLGCTAMVEGIAVVDVRHAEDGEVDHYLAQPGLTIGQRVTIQVDPGVRFNNARHHSAGHLIADAMADIVRQLTPLQGHHWPGESRVEFGGGADLPDDLASNLQRKVEAMIDAALPFCITGDPFASRALQIADYRPVPCGGTHVASSRDLAGLMIRKAQLKKGVVRISYGFD